MEEQKGQQSSSQPDKNLAADERPVPSQAEGDLETVEEDLKDKERQNQRASKGARSGQ
jgi:hypothetical protein